MKTFLYSTGCPAVMNNVVIYVLPAQRKTHSQFSGPQFLAENSVANFFITKDNWLSYDQMPKA